MTDQLRALVPGWVEWLGPLLCCLAVLVSICLVPLAAVRIPLRNLDEATHWTEQARVVHSARTGITWGLLLIPVYAWLLATMSVGPLSPITPGTIGLIAVGLAIGASMALSWWMEGSVLQQPVASFRRFAASFAFRLGPMVGIICLAIVAPSQVASPWMLPWLATAVALGTVLRFHPRLLARAGLARPVAEPVARLVTDAAERLELEVRSIVVIDHHQPNAFAFPWLGTVAFTSRAVAELTEDELEAVALHELGHLTESRRVSLLRQALHFVWIPAAAVRSLYGSWGVSGLTALVVLLVVVLVAVRRLGARMEARSDAHAVEHLHESVVFGQALEKIYRLGYIPAVLKRAAHGQLHERLEASGMVPDFTPPRPPTTRFLRAATGVAALLMVAVVGVPFAATVGAELSSPTPALVALSLGSYGSWPLERLGQIADAEGELAQAAVFYGGAAELTEDPDPLVDLVYVQSALGRCHEARESLGRLEQRSPAAGDLAVASDWLGWCAERSVEHPPGGQS